jgi:hypothetical protein
MAFNVTSQASKLVESVGSFTDLAHGMTVMASGTGTVTVPHFTRLDGIVGTVQGATGVGEMVICTATATNTATLETVGEGGSATGSSVVMWIAWGHAKR